MPSVNHSSLQIHKYNEKLIKQELERVQANIKKGSTQLVTYLINKIANHLVEGLNIDKQGIERIKHIAKEDRKSRIILFPVYKSYADTLIMHLVYQS